MGTMEAPVAIITGAGRGIGQAIALELSLRGYRLALAGRTESQLKQTASRTNNAIVIPTDVTDPLQVDALIKKTLASFGRIDVVVNNAGLAPVANMDETTFDQWQAVLNTNLSSAFYVSKAAWPAFKKQKSGCIVNISSMASRDPLPGFAAYGAAKAGLNLLTLVLAREGSAHGIRAYAIAPGAVETAMFRSIVSEEKWPKEKTLQPADVARVVAHCIDGDLKYTSGEVIFLSRAL
jgi:NAD(P)-dependent dehydrogenase (short-subunit alcohol dehydrogenase family)